MLKKIGKALKAIAPVAASVAATATLGPQVGAQIRSVLGLADNASDDDIEAAAVRADPSQLAALKKIDADLKRDLRGMDLKELEIQIEERKVYAADRADARQREIAVKDSTPRILTWTTIGIVGSIALALLFKDIPPDNKMLIGTVLGYFANQMQQQGSYYFGTSKSSAEKSQVIHKALDETAKARKAQ